MLESRTKKERLMEYASDLIWLIAKAKYDNFSAPMPSKVYSKGSKKDTRTAIQIIDDLINKCGEEG